MRRIALIAVLLAAAVGVLVANAGADGSRTYKVELDNGFGLVPGSDVKIAGVISGSITDLNIDAAKRAVITVKVSGPFADFHKDATCSSEPQSLIAEFFLDCQPGTSSQPLPNNFVPVAQTTTSVQNDLVANTLREPFKRRLQLIINEFGTALAGNPQNLNAAIRRGAPALSRLEKVLKILGNQNKVITKLNVDSDTIISKLAANRGNVVRFIDTANATAQATAERKADLARDFHLLPTTLKELQATMVALGHVADQQTPLLRDLNASSGQLFTLSKNLPPFNEATQASLTSLGSAAVVGQRALTKAQQKGVISQLRKASVNAYPTSKLLATLFKDLDNPNRNVETDARAAADTGRAAPTGYSGLEGLLNYVYYQTTAINQYDQVGHLLHFILEEVATGPCADYNAGPTWPKEGGGTTTDPKQAARCVSILGPTQPDINYPLNLPPYSGTVCPYGSTDLSICNPANLRKPTAAAAAAPQQPTGGTAPPPSGGATGPSGLLPNLPGLPKLPGLPNGLDQILGLPQAQLNNLRGLRGSAAPNDRAAANDLLNFLFAN